MNNFIGIRGSTVATVVFDGKPLTCPDGGFDWGFRGGGPTNLAKAMLGEYFAATYTGDPESLEDARQAFTDRYFHKFRDEVIGSIASATFQLNFDQIGAWLAAVEAIPGG